MPELPDWEKDHELWEFHQMRTDAELLGLDSVCEEAITSAQVVLAAHIKLRKLRRDLSVALVNVHPSKHLKSRSNTSSGLQPTSVWQEIRRVQAARDSLLSLQKNIQTDRVTD